jgi:hypothetical protein
MESHDPAVEKQLADLKRTQDEFEVQKKDAAKTAE